MTCPQCGSDDCTSVPYDYGTDRETGYRDAGVRARCAQCGCEADAEDFKSYDREGWLRKLVTFQTWLRKFMKVQIIVLVLILDFLGGGLFAAPWIKAKTDKWWLGRITGREFPMAGNAHVLRKTEFGDNIYCVLVSESKHGFVAQPTDCGILMFDYTFDTFGPGMQGRAWMDKDGHVYIQGLSSTSIQSERKPK